MNKLLISLLLTITILWGCEKNNPITNGKQIRVQQFEKELVLTGKPLTFIESKGIFGCEVRNPYLLLNLFNQDNFIAVYDLVEGKFLGNVFTKGKTNDEYVSFDMVNMYHDSVFWTIDPIRRIVREFAYKPMAKDSSQLFKNTNTWTCNIKAELFSAFPNGNMINTYKAFSTEEGLFYENVRTKKRINIYRQKISLNDLNRIKTLAESMKPDGSKIASFTGVWDAFDIVSLNDEQNYCIANTDELMSWSDFNQMSDNDIPEHYLSIPRSNNDYIALLHRYAENLEILFFDWDGRAIAKCHVKEKLVDFAVDWTNLTIYGVDENDMVYQYEPISSL